MTVDEILLALREKRITPAQARELMRERPAAAPEHGTDAPIAIVGMSGRYASARDLDQYWRLLDEGRSGVREIPPSRWDMTKYYDPEVGKEGAIYCRWMGILDDVDCFDTQFFGIAPAEAEMMDPLHRLFTEEGYRAFEDAGYTRKTLDGANTGVYLGMSNGDYQDLVQAESPDTPSVTSVSNAIAAARLAYFLNLKGPALTVDTACSSSLVCVHLAAAALRAGEIDMALAGGVALYLTPGSYVTMSEAGMLSPVGRCKAFDDGADGFVAGEGVGAVVLKRLADAERDGDHIYALISASGINQDGKSNGITAPSLGSQIELVRATYERHGIHPETIDYAELHGTGTKLGDPIELEALATAFRTWTDRTNFCDIGSVKSNIGHMSAAAGVASLHKVLLSLRHDRLVPTLHVDKPNEHFDFGASPFRIGTENRPWPAAGRPRRACVSSFGFSGTNAHVVVDEYVPNRTRTSTVDAGPHAFVLSARSAERLREYAATLSAHLAGHRDLGLADVAHTLRTDRDAMRVRLAIVESDLDGLIAALDSFARTGEVPAGDDSELARTAARWVSGADVTWPRPGTTARRIPLPTYPFEKKRHWYRTATAAAVLHPLVHENVPDAGVARFSSAFSGTEWFFTDHRVDGGGVLPGAAVVELARVAGTLSGGREVCEIGDLRWLWPVRGAVEVSLVPGDGGAAFEVRDGDGTLCANGRLTFGAAGTPEVVDLAAVRDRCAGPRREVYPDEAGAGVWYGPAFRTVREVACSGEEVLATLVHVRDDAYVLHPAVLDGAWQAVRPLLTGDAVRLPSGVDRIRWWGPVPDEAYAYVRRTGTDTFDVLVTDPSGAVVVAVDGFTVKATANTGEDRLFLTRRWDEESAPAAPAGTARTLAMFTDDGPLGSTARQVADIEVTVGTGFTVDETGARYTVRPADLDDCGALLAELRRRDLLPDRVLVVGADVHAVHALCRALAASRNRRPTELVYAYGVEPGQEPGARDTAMAAYLRCLAAEETFISARTIGITSPAQLGAELAAGGAADVWWDARTRRVARTVEVQAGESAPVFRDGGVYLITGGLGGLGLVFARYLARRYGARLVLSGRRELDDALRARLDTVTEIGAEVEYVRADVAERADVVALVAAARTRFGRIDGVLHSAAELRDGLVRTKPAEDLDAVLAPKVAGTRHLDEVLRDEPLDFFVLFSSMSAVLGNAGQSDYCFANAYQDGFAVVRERLRRAGHRSGRTLSIGWPYWTNGGMTVAPDAVRGMREHLGIAGLSDEDGCQALETALAMAEPRLTFVTGDATRIRRTFGLTADSGAAVPEAVAEVPVAPAGGVSRGRVVSYLRGVVGEGLHMPVDEVGVYDSFEDFGIDSILMMGLTRRLEADFGELPKTLFFEYGCVDELAGFFVAHKEAARLFGVSTSTVAPRETPRVARAVNRADTPGRDIAVVGVSGRYPEADDLDEFWSNLMAGRDCVREVPEDRWDHGEFFDPSGPRPGKSYAKWGGFLRDVDKFDPLFFGIPPREADFLDPQARLFLETAWHAVEDAGYTRGSLSGRSVGVFVGVMYGMYELFEGTVDGVGVPVPSSFAAIANRVSYFLDAHGPSMAVDTMCSSSLTTVHLGCESIRRGESDVVIAGGVNVTVHPNKLVLLSQGGFASTDGRCRSFGEGGDGYVPGEGVGAVVLKALDRAVADGDHIYAVIKGSAVNSGGRTTGFTVPSPAAQADLIRTGLADAGVDARSVSYVEAHGTGTSLGDPIEISALSKAFGETESCAIGSVKSNIGHLESAAGIAALTKVLLQLKHRKLVPSLHSGTLNPFIDFEHSPFTVQQEVADWARPVIDGTPQPRRAGISSFGAGGSNAHLVVEEYVAQASARAAKPGPYLFPFSATDTERLHAMISRFVPDTDTVLGRLRDHLAGQLGIDAGEIDADTPLTEYGLDRVGAAVLRDRAAGTLDGPALDVSELDTLTAWAAGVASATGTPLRHLDPEAVAHTLQVGREPLPQRLVVIADDLDELARLLSAYLDGTVTPGRVFTGATREVARQSQPLLDLITGSDLADQVLRTGQLDKAAELWTTGVAVDWRLLHTGTPPTRVSLPGYPFARERCWVTPPPRTATVLHPLVHQNVSDFQAQRFSSAFSGAEWFLNDHRVDGQKVLPGAAIVEQARVAGELSAGRPVSEVADLRWLWPVRGGVELTLEPAGGFEVRDDDATLCATGRLAFADHPVPENVDVTAVRARCGTEFGAVYGDRTGEGVWCGPALRTVHDIAYADDEALAVLAHPGDDAYVLHPALLDGAWQAVRPLLPAGDDVLLPAGMRRIRWWDAIPADALVHVRRTGTGEFDLTITHRDGTVAVEVTGFTVKARPDHTEPETATAEIVVSGDGLRARAVSYLRGVVSDGLRVPVERIGAVDSFEEFGIDSIVMMGLTRRLEADFGELPKTLFFEYGSVEELADFFVAHGDAARVLGDTTAPQPVPAIEKPRRQVAKVGRANRFAGRRDVAVVGVSGRYPEADDLGEFWSNLASGRDCVREVPEDRWDHGEFFDPSGPRPGKSYAKWGGFLRDVDKFDPLFFNISPSEADFLDPQIRLFLETAWHAVEDAGYTRGSLSDRSVGVFVGVMYGMYELLEGNVQGVGVPVPSSFASIANRVSYFLDAHGPSMAVDTMCSSSLTTVHLGCESIRRGESDVVIAGGVNVTIHPNKMVLLSQGHFVSTDGRCRSFGEGGDGYVPGEGVGAVVLKALDQAVADGDHIYAVIKGSAVNSGGRTTGFTVPNPGAQTDLVRTALSDAGVDARSVSYVEAHGTGTSLGDPIEISALSKAFGGAEACAIGSVKSNIGHLESAAGIAALTKVLLQLKHRKLVPSLHSATLNPFIDFEHGPFTVQQELADWARPDGTPRRAGVSSFGAGGANAHLVVEEYLPPASERAAKPGPYLFPFSAHTTERLHALVTRFLAGDLPADPESVAYTLQVGRESLPRRVAVLARDLDELATLLTAYLDGTTTPGRVFTGVTGGVQDRPILDVVAGADVANQLAGAGRLDKTAELWVNGVHVDWRLLHDDPPARVSLPGYPFARERCWVTPPPSTTTVLHPLVHRNSSSLDGLRYTTTFTGAEPVLTDHRVGGQPVLPAVAYLEMAMAAVRDALPDTARDTAIRLRDVVWPRPFTSAGTLHVTLTPGADGEVDFVIHGDAPYCQGTAQLTGAPAEETIDLAPLRAGERTDGSAYYATFERMGLDYGPAHRAIHAVHTGGGEALAELRLPDGVHAGGHTLHPSILDAALQATVALTGDTAPGGAAELPFAVDGVDVSGPVGPVMWAHLRRVDTGDGLRTVDIALCDETGRVAVRLHRVAFKAARVRDTGGLLLAPRWQEREPVAGPDVRFDRWAVLVCGRDDLAELRRRLPDTDCAAVTATATQPGARYRDHVVALLGATQDVLRRYRGERVLLQVVAPAGHEWAGLAAFLQSLHAEHPSVATQLVQTDGTPAVLAERLRAERGQPADHAIRYTEGKREVRDWVELSPAPAGPPLWRDGGAYLVTGGAGGLGLLVAEAIVGSTRDARVVLTGRGAQDDRITALVERLGAGVQYAQADVADAAAMRALIDRIGPLHGVLHCAGTTRDRMILRKTAEDADAVLTPKTAGLVTLDEVTSHLPLDHFVVFSSLAGAVGNAGQADYAAGNAFMDHFAAHRAELVARGERHGRTLSVNWQLWADGGMRPGAEAIRAAEDGAGLAVLDRATGLALLDTCVATGESQVLPLHGNTRKLRNYVRAATTNTLTQPTKTGSDQTERLADELKELIAGELRMTPDRIDSYTPWEQYGIDSVRIITLTERLETRFGPLSKTLFFENQTLIELAGALGRLEPRDLPAEPVTEPVAVPATGWAVNGWTTTPRADRADGGLDIAIVGLAGRFPQADDVNAYWTNLRDGRDCVTEIPADRWDHTSYGGDTYAKWGGFVDDADCFDSLFFNISPGEAEIMDPQERLFLECVQHVMDDAGYGRRTIAPEDGADLPRQVGVFVGVMYEEYQLYAAAQQLRGEPVTLGGTVASIANRVSYTFGFHGPSVAVNTMCSSSLVSLHLACQSLLAGECSVAVAGGVNLSLHPNKFLMLGRNRFASTRGRCESFGSDGDGYVPGEAVGALLLKPLARAEADGDHIYGVVKGTAVNHGGKTNGYTVPNPHAQAAVIRRAVRQAGVDPAAISYVEAHGTGTRLGDPIEVASLTTALASDATDHHCYLGSAKSNIGHCESAAGVAGIAKVLLQLRHGEIAPSLHSARPNPEIDFSATPFTVPQEVVPWRRPVVNSVEQPRIAGVSSFGAGGTNAHVVIAEYRRAATECPAATGEPLLVPLSARTGDQLRQVAERLLTWVRAHDLTAADLVDVAHTLQVGRDAYEERLGLVVRTPADLERELADFVAGKPLPHRGTAPTHGRATAPEAAAGDYETLLDRWVSGADLDWPALAAPGAGRRVSLPGYPLARQRHWQPGPDTATPRATVPAVTGGQAHPLLHENRSSLFEQRFSTTFTGGEPFLDDHRVHGRRVLPGAVTLEMARLAGALSLEREVRSIRDVTWPHPVEVGGTPVEVATTLVPAADAVLVQVGLGTGPVRMTARLDLEDTGTPPRHVDVPGLIARCDRKMTGEEVYAALAAAGLGNGPAFQVIDEVLFWAGGAVARLTLPPAAQRDRADVLHPALVNGAFQAVVAAMGREDRDNRAAPRLYLPFAIGRVDIGDPLPDECEVEIHRSATTNSPAVRRFDLTVADRTGRVVLDIRDFALIEAQNR